MKILYIGHTYTVRANQAKIAALGRAMPDSKITLLTPHAWRGPLYENLTDRFDSSMSPNVDHRILKAYLIGREGAFFYSPSLFKLVAQLKPDVVHVEQGAYALSYTQILLALKFFSPSSKASFFTWWNLPYQPTGLKQYSEAFNLSHSSCAIAGNVEAKMILRQHGFDRPVHVLPQLGVDLETIEDTTTLEQRDPSRFIVGYAGRIAEEKGVLDLVDAAGLAKTATNLSLYFVGSGNALPEVKKRAAYHGVEFMHHSAVRNDEIPQHLARMDILVLPSRSTPEWVEQFGHILLEAMALGIPVIGSSSGEIPNVIGDAGVIFQEADVRGLADAIVSLASNREMSASLSSKGRERIRSHFTHNIIAEKQTRIFDWMLQQGVPVGSRVTRHTSKQETLTSAL